LANIFKLKQIRLKKFLPGIIWFLLVLLLICLPQADIPEVDDWFHRVYFDKWVHAGMFGILAFLFMWPFQKSNLPDFRKKQTYLIIAILTSCWGFATECIQLYIPGRSYDLLDWMADSFGIVLVLIFARKRLI